MINNSNQGGRQIRTTDQPESSAYKSTDPPDTTPDRACNPANIVHVVRVVHGTESILHTTTCLSPWIQDPRVINQQRTPVLIQLDAVGRQFEPYLTTGSVSVCTAAPLCQLVMWPAQPQQQLQACLLRLAGSSWISIVGLGSLDM